MKEFRDDLAVMYLPTLDTGSGDLVGSPFEIFQIRKFRLQRASVADARWLHAALDR
jgi:hypothetical protein